LSRSAAAFLTALFRYAASPLFPPISPGFLSWYFAGFGIGLQSAQRVGSDSRLGSSIPSPIPEVVAFVKAFFDAKKPVSVICHGPWTIIEEGQARGRRIASWPSLKTDIRSAGAEWVDE
jgi:hypothetical protein